MSYDPDFEKRINNKLETIIENQAIFDEKMRVMQEAIAGLIQVARLHDEQLDEVRRQIAENGRQIAELREQGREQDARLDAQRRGQDERLNALRRGQDERLNALRREQDERLNVLRREQDARLDALIRIVEGHISHHP